MDKELKYYGCCGLNCEKCPVFLATINNDEKLREETAREWSKIFSGVLTTYVGKDFLTSTDMNCHGCQSKGDALFIGCAKCPIRACCGQNELKQCAQCDKFDTCEMLTGFFQLHEEAETNLRKMRKGLKSI